MPNPFPILQTEPQTPEEKLRYWQYLFGTGPDLRSQAAQPPYPALEEPAPVKPEMPATEAYEGILRDPKTLEQLAPPKVPAWREALGTGLEAFLGMTRVPREVGAKVGERVRTGRYPERAAQATQEIEMSRRGAEAERGRIGTETERMRAEAYGESVRGQSEYMRVLAEAAKTANRYQARPDGSVFDTKAGRVIPPPDAEALTRESRARDAAKYGLKEGTTEFAQYVLTGKYDLPKPTTPRLYPLSPGGKLVDEAGKTVAEQAPLPPREPRTDPTRNIASLFAARTQILDMMDRYRGNPEVQAQFKAQLAAIDAQLRALGVVLPETGEDKGGGEVEKPKPSSWRDYIPRNLRPGIFGPESTPQPQGPQGTPTSQPSVSVGQTVTLRNGTRGRVTKVYPDGTFDYDPVR